MTNFKFQKCKHSTNSNWNVIFIFSKTASRDFFAIHSKIIRKKSFFQTWTFGCSICCGLLNWSAFWFSSVSKASTRLKIAFVIPFSNWSVLEMVPSVAVEGGFMMPSLVVGVTSIFWLKNFHTNTEILKYNSQKDMKIVPLLVLAVSILVGYYVYSTGKDGMRNFEYFWEKCEMICSKFKFICLMNDLIWRNIMKMLIWMILACSFLGHNFFPKSRYFFLVD